MGGLNLCLKAVGVSHKAQQWQLTIIGERGERFPGSDLAVGGERCADEGNVDLKRSPAQPIDINGVGERGERGERFLTLTHARAHAHAMEDTEKPSPRSPRSPSEEKSGTCTGERSGNVNHQPPRPLQPAGRSARLGNRPRSRRRPRHDTTGRRCRARQCSRTGTPRMAGGDHGMNHASLPRPP